MFEIMIKCLPLLIIPIVIKYLIRWLINKSNNNEIKKTEFSFLVEIKTLMLGVFLLALILSIACIEQNKENDFIDTIIYLMLPSMCLFPIMYTWGIKITFSDEWDYLKYRNIIFYTKKIYYKDIDYIQIVSKTLHIALKNKRVIKVLDIDWLGCDSLIKLMREKDINIKKRIYKR